jgi:hypothetical protein
MTKARKPQSASFSREVLRALVLGAVPVALGVAGVWLTPLRDVIAHAIWSERATLTVAIPRVDLQEGDEFEVQVIAQPASPVAISPGVLEVTAASEILMAATTDNRTEVPALVNPAIVNKAKPARFVAVSPGTTSITAVLQTARNRYETSETVTVRPRPSTGVPSARNYSGRWELRLGAYRGQMALNEQGALVNGSYSLDDSIRGVVDAVRDGTALHGTFYRGNSTTKWIVVAETHASPDYVEITGTATLYKAAADGWRPNGATEQFYAVAKLHP